MNRCITCGNGLTGRQKSHCSQICASKTFNAQRVADGRLKGVKKSVKAKAWVENAKEERECAACGNTFMVYRYNVSKHCSPRCGLQMSLGSCKLPLDHPVMIGIATKHRAERIAKIEARVRERELNAYRRIWVSGRCKRCGESFIAEWMSMPDLSRQPQYCSTNCGERSAKDRRNAIKRDAFVANVYRYQIFERDNWICQLCFKPIDRDVKAGELMSVSLDHILALANGGTHEPSNTQTAHFICNSLKGDRDGFAFVA